MYSIYIPLCFYFIIQKRSSQKGLSLFTFHYASTLSVSGGLNGVQHALYLHSTMLLLYLPKHLLPRGSAHIYIPLCFYFIERRKIRYARTIHLHSTMLLLYLMFLINLLMRLQIYIPLCFYFIPSWRRLSSRSRSYLHSTMLLLYPVLRSSHLFLLKNLHSTMLLLYRRPEGFPSQGPGKFTFHYASTLSVFHHVLNPAESLFTFHYASTLSLSVWIVSSQSSSIYIPLCFYFIGNTAVPSRIFPSFTFHYASTLSGLIALMSPNPERIYIPLCFYFICLTCDQDHLLVFIYIPLCFYFILRCAFPHVASDIIYIPLCFYFIETDQLSKTMDAHHLHSTMLLLYHATPQMG